MHSPPIDGRKNSRQKQEEIRLEAVKRVLTGESPETVIRETGLHRSNIYNWLKSYDREGSEGLQRKTASGRPAKINSVQSDEILDFIGNNPAEVWTRDTLRNLILEQYELNLGTRACQTLLESWGMPSGRPYERLVKAGDSATINWLSTDYSALKERAYRERASLCFLEEMETENGYHFLCCTTAKGTTYFSASPLETNSRTVHLFIQKIAYVLKRKIIVIAPGNRVLQQKLADCPESNAQEQIELLFYPVQPQQEKTKQSTIRRQKVVTEETYPPIKDLEKWILLLNRSLLDKDYPLSNFLFAIGNALGGLAGLATDLYNPSSLLRRKLTDTNLEGAILTDKYILDSWPHNPFVSALKKPGDLYTMDELVPRDQWPDHAYCRIFTHADDPGQTIGLCFAGAETSLCLLLISRFSPEGYTEEEKTLIRQLRPHLEVAIQTLTQYWRGAYTVTALEEATSHLGNIIFVLDGNGKLIPTHNTAGKLSELKHCLMTYNNHIRFLNTDQQKQFEAAVQNAIRWRRAPRGEKPVEAIRFELSEGEWIGLLIQPITPPTFSIPHSAAVAPHVIVYVNSPTRPRPKPEQQLIARLFDLSTQEARLTALLAHGSTIDEAAKQMNITLTTARTYLQHIYEKVGVRRQQDLLQQVLKSVALLV